MTRQQEKVVLQRLSTIKAQKMDALCKERNERARGIASVWRRLADHIEKHAKTASSLLAKVLEDMRSGLTCGISMYVRSLPEYGKFYKAEQAERAELDREFAARENKLSAAAENMAIQLVLGNDADEVIALLEQFGKEKF